MDKHLSPIMKFLENTDGFIAAAENLLQSDSYICISIGLCALTGRSPTEILVTAKFEKTEKRNIILPHNSKDNIKIDNGVIFIRQTGITDTSIKDKRERYLIPTLVNGDTVIKGFNKLRKIKYLSHMPRTVTVSGRTQTLAQRINNLTAKERTQCVKRHFDKFIKTVTPANLWQIYMHICANRYTSQFYQRQLLGDVILGQHCPHTLKVEDMRTEKTSVFRPCKICTANYFVRQTITKMCKNGSFKEASVYATQNKIMASPIGIEAHYTRIALKGYCIFLAPIEKTNLNLSDPERLKYLPQGYQAADFVLTEKTSTKSDFVLVLEEIPKKTIKARTSGEDEFARYLYGIFPGTKIIREFPVYQYRVDFYFPLNGIAVEYDGAYHKQEKQKQKDIARQKDIEDKLGCTFVRINADNPGKGILDIQTLLNQ